MDDQDVCSIGFCFSETSVVVLILLALFILFCFNNFPTMIAKVVAKTRLQKSVCKIVCSTARYLLRGAATFSPTLVDLSIACRWETLLLERTSAGEVHDGVWRLLEVNLLDRMFLEKNSSAIHLKKISPFR